MKTIVKQPAIKNGIKKDIHALRGSDNSNEIKPDFPLSEKDEEKAAEEKMRRNVKKKRLL